MFQKVQHTYGYEQYVNKVLNFMSTDTEELYNSSLKIKPADWYYRKKKILYSFNELGHRSISSIPFQKDQTPKDYILAIGCSFTEGVGIANDELFHQQVGAKLKIPVYNMGLGGSGCDFLSINLYEWLTHYQKPKAIIIQWPQPDRKFYYPLDTSLNTIHCIGPWVVNITNFNTAKDRLEAFKFKSLLATDALTHFSNVIQSGIKAMLVASNIPFVELYSNGYTDFDANLADDHVIVTTMTGYKGDFARDLAHPGVVWNTEAAECISQKLINQFNQK